MHIPSRVISYAPAAALLAALGAAAWLLRLFLALPDAEALRAGQGRGIPVDLPALPTANFSHANAWSTIQGAAPSASGGSKLNLRLSGTFFQYREDGTSEERKAIIESLATAQHHVVTEGDVLDEFRVTRIHDDHVLLDQGGAEHTLWMSFTRPDGTETGAVANAAGADFGRYGTKQIGQKRWMFRREPLLAYYSELMDQPERLLKVFDSFKPDYSETGAIRGYKIQMEGEEDFFSSVGLQQNDFVRSVNSLPMTNKRRAEFFIRQFVADRANAFVIELEREGARQKLVYEVR